MRLLTRRKTPTEELKDAAIEALVNALDDDKRAAKPGTKGVRALAAGAVIYAAGRAAFKGQRFVREQLSSDTDDDQAEDLEDEEETRAYEEPEGEEYEVDEEDDEPEEVEDDEEPESYEEDAEPEEVEEDEEPETYEDDEEPEAYEDDDEEPEAVRGGRGARGVRGRRGARGVRGRRGARGVRGRRRRARRAQADAASGAQEGRAAEPQATDAEARTNPDVQGLSASDRREHRD